MGDFILAGNYAGALLEWPGLPGGYSMLAHLYSAEALIIQVNHMFCWRGRSMAINRYFRLNFTGISFLNLSISGLI